MSRPDDSTDGNGVVGVELRQIRYFVSLAEELHFGRAATREHIVQSALSQQLQRLERELGVRLMDRSTHHVELTEAGRAFLTEGRQVLLTVERAAEAARRGASIAPTLRAGIVDACYDSMPKILGEVQTRHADLEIHQIEATMPEQIRLLTEGRLDVGFGPAGLAPPELASELVRLDRLGVVVSMTDRLAELPGVPVAALVTAPLLFADDKKAPDLNRAIIELCRFAGFAPVRHRGSVGSVRAAQDLILNGHCLFCAPASCASSLVGTVWKPLIQPIAHFPWSVVWHNGNKSGYVRAVVASARVLSRQLRWLDIANGLIPAAATGMPGLSAGAEQRSG